MEWISVKDRLPDGMDIYATLVRDGSGYKYMMQLCGDGVNFIIGTTHWFSLPELPTK